jgi:hypothetical protein
MPTHIGREDVQRLVAEGAQLVEVLPQEEFDKQHFRARSTSRFGRSTRGSGPAWIPSAPSSSTAGTPPET